MSYKNSVFLITGGTGSFGHAVMDRLLQTEAKEIRIFSRDEKKQDDMRRHYSNDRLKFYIGDVRDKDSIKNAMHGVDYLFHAAALKQVPSAEFFPIEAVKTNIIGTENVLDVAISAGVKKVVCLSTDKAAYPINAMGISKAMMERVAIAKSKTVDAKQTSIMVTRYGNVMGSRGSVIPLFLEQIKSNKPLTITEPSMTRFLMNLNEAVELVLYAFENGESGDLFVQKSPASTVGQLAKVIQDILKTNNPVQVIGARHGEKLYETLLTKEEQLNAIDQKDYFRVPADQRDLNYGKYFSEGQMNLLQLEEYTSHNTTQLSNEELKAKLLELEIIQEALKG
jgi:UDP-N-acetylglucosamine 4,6-dehydratase/5-epimerase